MTQRTVAVLGGGSAGFTAARTAAKQGARVLFFMGDNADAASLCVNRGCMPSKAMFQPIDVMHHARKQRWLRVEPVQPDAYLGQIVAWKDREIARFRAYRQRAIHNHASNDFQVIRSDARFVDPHTLESAGERDTFDAAVIATGSGPAFPPVDGLAELREHIWSSDEFLSNTRLPESLTVIGAGAIGLEFALRYARLGCAVTMIARSRPLSTWPAAFGDRIAEIYEHEGIRMMRGTTPQSVYRDGEGMFIVNVEGPTGFEPVAAHQLAVVAGRRPMLDSLDIGNAGIEPTRRGLEVGEDMRVTGTDHIFAAGDVIGRRMVVHQAHIEAGVAAENAVTEGSREWHQRSRIMVVYSDPEFGYAGMTPDEAEAAGHKLVVGRKESRLVGKLHLAGDDHGFGEIMADADTHQLLGAGLLCDHASDLIHLPAYLIDQEHTVYNGVNAEYYHPTRIEIVAEILDGLCRDLGGKPPKRADENTG
ncbi:MAG: hypothetical protein GKS06_10425 [Acidobacteria bacterium]|nr:hypothetical protein [Acidobacteriota bacterium]